MSIKVEQTWEGIDLQLENGDGTKKGSTATVYYLVSGTADDVEAIMTAYSEAVPEISSIPKSGASISERLAEDIWKIEITYAHQSSGSANNSGSGDTSTLSFECGGGTKKVKTSIGEQRRVINNNAPDPGHFIGWNGKSGDDSQIDGVDIPTAQMRETYTKEMNLSSLSTSYRRRVAAMVGKVNSGKFKGWERGEVMFLGCSFSGSKADGKITVSFNFNIQPGETVDLSDIAEGESGTVSKEGFEYIWTISETKTENKQPKTVVKGAWIAKVTGYADFSQLGV